MKAKLFSLMFVVVLLIGLTACDPVITPVASNDSTVTPTDLPVEQLPPLALTEQDSTAVSVDGQVVTDANNISASVPDGSVQGAEVVRLIAYQPPEEFDADLAQNGWKRQSPLYSLVLDGEGENVGGAQLSFPANGADDRLAALVDGRYLAVLGVLPQDGRLDVTATVKPGPGAFAGLETVEGGGVTYFVVSGAGSAQSLQLPLSSLAGGFGSLPGTALLTSLSMPAGGTFRPAAVSTVECRAATFNRQSTDYTPKVCWNEDKSIFFLNGGPSEEDRQAAVGLLDAATVIRDSYAGLGIRRVPTTADPLMIIQVSSGGNPNYDPIYHNISLDFKDISRMNEASAQQVLAHEMFHWIEHKTFPMLRRGNNTWFTWQMETSAEAATFLINPQYQNVALSRRGALQHSNSNQVLGWQEPAGDWSTWLFGAKIDVDEDRYIQGITVRMGICPGSGCMRTVSDFVDKINTGIIFEDAPEFYELYPRALRNTATYLLGKEPKGVYSPPGVLFSASELLYGRGIGDWAHVGNYGQEYLVISSSASTANLTKVKQTGIATINAVIGRQALYPLRVSNGADYPLEDSGYTGTRAQPNVPYSLRIEAGVPFIYRAGNGSLVERDGKEATVIEPITSEPTVSVQEKGGAWHNVAGIPSVRLVAINATAQNMTLQGTFAPMPPVITVKPQRITITDLTTPVPLEIKVERIFPNIKFTVVIDYGDGSPEERIKATPDGKKQALIPVNHIFKNVSVKEVHIDFLDETNRCCLWKSMIIPVEIKLTPTRTATPTSTATPTPTLTATPTLAGDLSTGYWRYVEPYTYTKEFIYDDPSRDVHKINISEGGGSHYHKAIMQDLIQFATKEFNCTWAITSPTSLEKLNPGDTLEATASCTDTSKYNADETYDISGGSLKFAINPPGVEAYAGEMVAFQMGFGYQESKTTTGTLIVPAGPLGGDWNNKIGVGFHLAYSGMTQRIYEWVPPGEDRTQIPTKVTPTKVAAEMVVNGLVLDVATQKPLAKAWVAMLLPGITASDWQELEFPKSAVLAYGQSDSQGRFSLVDPVDMATPVYLERNIAYSVFAWLDGYQNVLTDGLIIDDSKSSPVKLTITMQQR
jgi:hypothetical protein